MFEGVFVQRNGTKTTSYGPVYTKCGYCGFEDADDPDWFVGRPLSAPAAEWRAKHDLDADPVVLCMLCDMAADGVVAAVEFDRPLTEAAKLEITVARFLNAAMVLARSRRP